MPHRHFASTYSEAREKFLGACHGAGLVPETFDHPDKGPAGESLHADAVWIGPEDAERVLVLSSGTHGVEGFCGSGVFVGWLVERLFRDVPEGTAVLLIHAVNPYGFAWLRRVNEDNVDLARNWLDFSRPLPENPGYLVLADAIAPRDWDGPERRDADRRLAEYRATHGHAAFLAAVVGAQFSHPDGLFFGGHTVSWSRRVHEALGGKHLGRARHVGLIDFHTGLGPYGYGEPICFYPRTTATARRLRDWYGDSLTQPDEGNSTMPPVHGLLYPGYEAMLPHAQVTGIPIEFGAYAFDAVIEALRADNWVHLHGDPLSREGKEIKAAIRKAFYPDKDDWKEMIRFRGNQVIRQALAGLSRSPRA